MNFIKKTVRFLTAEWFAHNTTVLVFLSSPPWRWPHEWAKYVGV